MKTLDEWAIDGWRAISYAGMHSVMKDVRTEGLDTAIAALRKLREPLTDKALRGVLLQGIDAIEALKEEP